MASPICPNKLPVVPDMLRYMSEPFHELESAARGALRQIAAVVVLLVLLGLLANLIAG